MNDDVIGQVTCRRGCGACCIAPSIETPMPGMPNGKPAGVRCVHLDDSFNCALFNKPERPDFCKRLQASVEMCGDTRQHAMVYLARLDELTRGL